MTKLVINTTVFKRGTKHAKNSSIIVPIEISSLSSTRLKKTTIKVKMIEKTIEKM